MNFILLRVLALGLAVTTAARLHAADGTWLQTAAGPFNWGDAGNWTGGTVADGADFTAFFTPNITAAQTVNLDAARTIGNITFTDTTTSSHDLTISGANILTLDVTAGAPVINVTQAGRTLTISSVIAGNDGLTKSGAGQLTLSGANTYSGGTTVSAGVVNVNNASAFGTGTVTIAGSSTLNFQSGLTVANDIQVNAALTVRDIMAAANAITFTGVLSGSGNITIQNNGVNGTRGEFAFVNAANTWTGNVIMPSGNAVGYDQFTFNSIGDGGNFTLQKTGNQNMIAYTGSSNIVFNTRVLNVGAINNIFDGGGVNPINMFANNGTGTVTFNTNMTVAATVGANSPMLFFGGTNTGDNTFAGNIPNPVTSGNLGIGKTGTGRWILTGANAYLGETLIRNGTLAVDSMSSIVNNQPLGRNQIVQIGHQGDTGTLEYIGASNSSTDKIVRIGNTVAAQTGGGRILNNGTGTLTFAGATFNTAIAAITATRTLTLGGTNTGANEIQGTIQDNVAGTGRIALAKIGAGTWTLSGANTYSGGTTIGNNTQNVGTLNITNGSALGTGAVSIVSNTGGGFLAALTLNSTTGITVANNFTTSGTGQGNNGIIRNVTGINVISGNFTLGSGGGDTRIQSDGGSLTLTGNIAPNTTARNLRLSGSAIGLVSGAINNGAGANTLAGLFKEGSGTWTLTGANTYSGNTTVNAGTLLVNNTTGSGTGTGNVTVNGGVFGGTGSLTGTVTVNNTGTLAPGASIESLVSGALTMNAGSTFAYEAADSTASGADVMIVNGALSLTGVNLDLTAADLSAGTWTIGDKLTLISYTGTAITGGFTGYIDDTQYFFGANGWTINYDDIAEGSNFAAQVPDGVNYVTLQFTAIPEPGTVGLLGLALCGAGAWFRRRRA